MTPTVDPSVFVEEQGRDYRLYRNVQTGRRWQVFGECSKRGSCTNHEPVDELPVVTPEVICECPLSFTELPPARPS